MDKMDILIGCEYSGTVRDEFIKRGHNAISCDLLPTEKEGPHYQGDIFDLLYHKWDMIIAHPPCTYLTVSANRWLKDQPARKSGVLVGEARREARREAIDFVKRIMAAPCEKIIVENPIGVLSTEIRKPDQIIQPWQFGHPETKATCLWLKGVLALIPTNIVPLPEKESERMKIFHMSPSPDRWKERSLTYPGIAQAMANQWG
jgi:hypothetical protein